MLKTMQVFVEDVMYVYQGEIPISGGHAAYQWSCEEPGITSKPYQIVVTSV